MKTAQQRDAVNAHRRKLRAVNRDAKLAKRRAEYSTNRDKINEQKRAWYQANIERERAHHRVRERQRWQVCGMLEDGTRIAGIRAQAGA